MLFAAATNVAVDRVLDGLLKEGCADFARVGSVKRIAKPVRCVACGSACLVRLCPSRRHPCSSLPMHAQLLAHALPYDNTDAAIESSVRDLKLLKQQAVEAGADAADTDLMAINAALAMLQERRVRAGGGHDARTAQAVT